MKTKKLIAFLAAAVIAIGAITTGTVLLTQTKGKPSNALKAEYTGYTLTLDKNILTFNGLPQRPAATLNYNGNAVSLDGWTIMYVYVAGQRAAPLDSGATYMSSSTTIYIAAALNTDTLAELWNSGGFGSTYVQAAAVIGAYPSATFEFAPESIDKVTLSLDEYFFLYDGTSEYKPDPKKVINGVELLGNTHFAKRKYFRAPDFDNVTTDFTSPGIITIEVKGQNGITGTRYINYSILDSNIMGRVGELEAQIIQLQTQLNNAKSDLEQKITEAKNEATEALNAEIETLNDVIDSLTQQLNDYIAMDAIDDLEYTETIKELKQKIIDAEKAAKDAAHAELDAEIEKLNYANTIAALNKIIEDLEKELECANKALDEKIIEYNDALDKKLTQYMEDHANDYQYGYYDGYTSYVREYGFITWKVLVENEYIAGPLTTYAQYGDKSNIAYGDTIRDITKTNPDNPSYTPVIIPTVHSKEYTYTFSHWSLTPQTGKETNPIAPLPKTRDATDVIYYAQYDRAPRVYDIEWVIPTTVTAGQLNYSGGNKVTISAAYGADILTEVLISEVLDALAPLTTIADAANHVNYIFVGWASSSSGGSNVIFNTVTGARTFYARYILQSTV